MVSTSPQFQSVAPPRLGYLYGLLLCLLSIAAQPLRGQAPAIASPEFPKFDFAGGYPKKQELKGTDLDTRLAAVEGLIEDIIDYRIQLDSYLKSLNAFANNELKNFSAEIETAHAQNKISADEYKALMTKHNSMLHEINNPQSITRTQYRNYDGRSKSFLKSSYKTRDQIMWEKRKF